MLRGIGFVDGHSHVVMTGGALLKAQLRPAKDLADIQATVKTWAKENPEVGCSEWIAVRLARDLP